MALPTTTTAKPLSASHQPRSARFAAPKHRQKGVVNNDFCRTLPLRPSAYFGLLPRISGLPLSLSARRDMRFGSL